jgi:hypothetical protein
LITTIESIPLISNSKSSKSPIFFSWKLYSQLQAGGLLLSRLRPPATFEDELGPDDGREPNNGPNSRTPTLPRSPGLDMTRRCCCEQETSDFTVARNPHVSQTGKSAFPTDRLDHVSQV